MMIFSNDVLQAIVMDGVAEASLGKLELIFRLNKNLLQIKSRKAHLNWEDHVTNLQHSIEFESTYHMAVTSFTTLVNILRNDITVNKARSQASSSENEPIYPELVTGAGLPFLGGEGSQNSQRVVEIFILFLHCP